MEITDQNNRGSFADIIHELWSIESLLVQSLPSMVAESNNKGLKLSLAQHLAETRQHKAKIEFIAKQLKVDLGKANDPELTALLDQGKDQIKDSGFTKSKDELIIKNCVLVEEYEIARYTNAVKVATQLSMKEVASVLAWILEEEQQSRSKLHFLNKNLSLVF